jgi:hypothetical protein
VEGAQSPFCLHEILIFEATERVHVSRHVSSEHNFSNFYQATATSGGPTFIFDDTVSCYVFSCVSFYFHQHRVFVVFISDYFFFPPPEGVPTLM